ncbi:hypothetical protein RRG08_065202 [Elysia crispata]|uniref:Uncharacterized protein n=1 Tax=Elysia crispata TaxID=231223 RepID=A0AAE0YMT0_9GAST|nr:hypothetical protein RRG08_065202 [Elysia crispata]
MATLEPAWTEAMVAPDFACWCADTLVDSQCDPLTRQSKSWTWRAASLPTSLPTMYPETASQLPTDLVVGQPTHFSTQPIP